jgi:hypothetical protein
VLAWFLNEITDRGLSGVVRGVKVFRITGVGHVGALLIVPYFDSCCMEIDQWRGHKT